MAERLYELASSTRRCAATRRVFDLYCGIGTIGSPWRRARERDRLEIVEAGGRRRDRERAHQRDHNASLLRRRRAARCASSSSRMGRPDVAVDRPPAPGSPQKIVRRMVEAAPSRIVYVSCNPTTLAPNAAQLVEAGYRLVRVRPVAVPADAAHRVRGAA